jgi:F0F1-type ATP synthase membrane subunit b/b'
MDFPGRYPGYSKKKVRIEEDTIHIDVEDILNLQLMGKYLPTYQHLDAIVKAPLKEVKQVEENFKRGEFYRGFRDLYRSCVTLGNRLIVIAEIVIDRWKLKSLWGGGRRYRGHKLFGSTPRKTSDRLGDFSGMSRYKDKKGLIQVYYYYMIKELDLEYRQKRKYPTNEMYDRQKEIKAKLKDAEYLDESYPELEQELVTLTEQIKQIKQEAQEIQNQRNAKASNLIEEEKEKIKEILLIIQPYRSIKGEYYLDFGWRKGSGLEKEYMHKYRLITDALFKRYYQALAVFIKPITNWEEIDENPELKQQIQQQVDEIKKPFQEEYNNLLQQFKAEFTAILKTKFYEPLEKVKEQITGDFEKLQDLQTTLTQKRDFYRGKVLLLVDKHEKR